MSAFSLIPHLETGKEQKRHNRDHQCPCIQKKGFTFFTEGFFFLWYSLQNKKNTPSSSGFLLKHHNAWSPWFFTQTPTINHLHFSSSRFLSFQAKTKKTITQNIFFSTYTYNFQASKEHTRWEHKKKKRDKGSQTR